MKKNKKYTREQIEAAIIEYRNSDMTLKEIAKRHDINYESLKFRIYRGTFTSDPQCNNIPGNCGTRNRSAKFTEHQVCVIRKICDKKLMTVKELAKHCKVSTYAIRAIANRWTWKHVKEESNVM